MSWYNNSASDDAIVLFSEARYSRNLAALPFDLCQNDKAFRDIEARMENILTKNGFKCERLTEGVSVYALSLVEKQFIGNGTAHAAHTRTVYVNDPCNLVVSLGGSDHLSIRSVLSGRSIAEAKNSASKAEELLDRDIDFAFSERIGYLSKRPTDCGSGMTLRACLYMPSLRHGGEYERLRVQLLRLGVTLSPLLSGAQNEGDLYTVAHTLPYLSDEDAVTERFSTLVDKLSANELRALRMLYPDGSPTICDRAARAFGIMSYATRLGECELLSFISDIRIALCLDCAENIAIGISDLNLLCIEGLSCSLMCAADQKCESLIDCERLRSAFVKKYISSRVSPAGI